MLRWLAGGVGRVALSLTILFAVMEGALRLAPTLIPPDVLLHFEPALRTRLAQGRFSTREDVQPVPREDGGPPLWIYRPFTDKVYDFPDAGVVRVATSDEVGFCNPPGAYAAPHVDLVAVGDSFTWCHAVRTEEAWPLRLGALTGLSTYNLGMGGIGLHEELQILRRYGLSKSPRVVVMNVYEGNDLRAAVEYHAYREAGGPPEAVVEPGGWRETFAGRHSLAFNLAAAGLSWWAAERAHDREKVDVDFRYRLVEGDLEVPFNLEEWDKNEVRDALRLRAGEIDLSAFDDALEDFAALSRRHGFVAVLAYSPSAHTAYAEHVVFSDPDLAELLAWFSGEQRAWLARRSGELGLLFVDLTPVLQGAAAELDPERLLYYPTSLHFTARANALVATTLAEALRERAGTRIFRGASVAVPTRGSHTP